jgi:hypothetical protein
MILLEKCGWDGLSERVRVALSLPRLSGHPTKVGTTSIGRE